MRNFILLIFLHLSFISAAQNETFSYGGNDDDVGYAFALNDLGGYILASAERTAIDSSEQFSLINMDEKGNVVWHKAFGDIHSDIPARIEATSDGGFIIGGTKHDGGFTTLDAYAMKIDKFGTVLWDNYYGGSGRDEGYSINETSDGGFILTGFTNSDAPLSYGQMFVVKMDNGGTQEWIKYFGGSDKDYGFDVIETSDGNFVATGVFAGFHLYSTFEFTEPHSDVLVVKMDTQGNTIWSNTYGGIENEFSYQIKEAPDGGLYLMGSTQSAGNGSFDMNLIKLDAGGTELWSKTYGDVGFDYGKSMDISSDGFLYLTGSTNVDTVSYETDIIVIKTDLDGNEIWSTTLGGDRSDYGNFIRATPDNGCAVIGRSRSFGAGEDNIFFAKLGENGLIEPLSGSETTSLLIYPNPATTDITFYIEDKESCEEYTYEFYDLNGKLIQKHIRSSKQTHIDVTTLGQGTYMYRVTAACIPEFRGKFIVH